MNSTSCLMGLSPNLTATTVEGFKYESKEEFRAFLQKLNQQVAKSEDTYVKSRGNPSITSYQHDQEVPPEIIKVIEDCRQTDDDSDGDYEQVHEPPPDLPDRKAIKPGPVSPAGTTPTTKPGPANTASQANTKVKPKQHKPGIFSDLKSKFQKQKSDEKSAGADTGGQKHVKDTAKSKAPPQVHRKPSTEDTDTSTGAGPPPIPKKTIKETEPEPGDTRTQPTDGPPAVPTKPRPNKRKEKADAPRAQRPPAYENNIPSATVRPMNATSSIPAIKEDRKPEPLPTDAPSILVDTAGGEYVYVDESTMRMPEEIYSRSEEEDKKVPNEYIQVRSGKSNLRVKCLRRSQEMSMKQKQRPAVPDPADTITEQSDSKEHATETEHANDAVKESEQFNITNLSISEVASALKELRLDKYIEEFEENQIDGEILAQLTTDDMVTELSMKKLEAIRLSRYIERGHIPK